MDKLIINGGFPLRGETMLAGAKNVALKALVASILTDEKVVLGNIPHIHDVQFMLEVLRSLGIRSEFNHHTVTIASGHIHNTTVPLEVGARLRTSSMVVGPMLARCGEAKIPNPGGCRIGARPIDRHIDALRQMGATITYNSTDGYFHAKASALHGTTVTFAKNTHTGTETLILAAVLAKGRTVLTNAAQEVEVDNLIALLNTMGAKVHRTAPRTIIIDGVTHLSGTEFSIMPDRNEEVTFAIAALMTGGSISVCGSQREYISAFLDAFTRAGGISVAANEDVTTYRYRNGCTATDVVTQPYPGFMTDWQAPWAALMTQATGASTIHETIFESRFSYVHQLQKMGANITFFDPKVATPHTFYNFNWDDHTLEHHQGIKITGPTKLHNAILEIGDLRAGATLLLAALAAKGQSTIFGVEQIDRGYETIEKRLSALGAHVRRATEDRV